MNNELQETLIRLITTLQNKVGEQEEYLSMAQNDERVEGIILGLEYAITKLKEKLGE